MTEHIKRLQRYLERLAKDIQYGKEHIHGFDVGAPSEAVLHASDIRAVISRVSELESQLESIGAGGVERLRSGDDRVKQLEEALYTVIEGWTLPPDARKILETAYCADPPELPTLKAEPFLQDITDALRAANLRLIRTADSYRIEPASTAYATNVRAQPAVEPVAIPDGWRLVPTRLTQAMADAAKTVDGRLSVWKYDDAYQAMLANAPEAPAPAPNALDAETA